VTGPLAEIVVCTAYSDVDPAESAAACRPADRLFYLQKPFHPHEVRQLAYALGEKRASETAPRARGSRLRPAHRPAEPRPLPEAPARGSAGGCRRRPLARRLLRVDLDNFRRVNDVLGHSTATSLLRSVANHFRRILRRDERAGARGRPATATEDIARLGGDQFLVLLHQVR